MDYLQTEANYEKARLVASQANDQPINKRSDMRQKQIMRKVEYQ